MKSVIDGAEGTLRQFSLQSSNNAEKNLKVSQVNKIFVTHMHRESVFKCMYASRLFKPDNRRDCITADHIMGIPTLLREILGFPHPEKISPRGTPVGVLSYVSGKSIKYRQKL